MRTPEAGDPRPHCSTSRARASRRVPGPSAIVSVLLVAVLGVVLVPLGSPFGTPFGVSAQTGDDAAEEAAREIQQARDRANAAAQSFLDAQSELEVLQDDATRLELEAKQLEATVADLRSQVESVALARFIGTGSSGIPLLTGLQDPQEQVQAAVFVDLMTNTGSDALDQYDVAQKDLAATRRDLERRRGDIEAQKEVFARLQTDAENEVQRLREVEAKRLNDEAVRKALEAKLAAERERADEAARAAAEAAARAAPNPGAQQTQSAAQTPTTDGSGSSDGSSDSTAPPSTAAPANQGASGGTSGGRTGVSGGGNTPVAPPSAPAVVGGLVCPIPGSAYGDTFGAARSGGRRHEGVDMLAPSGTPIFAVIGGFASFKQTNLGGNSVSLAGDDGTRYFYAHLSSFEGSSRRVSQGELIGYAGDTGNARGVPHLHFEVHPGGGAAINPTPTVRAAGC
jgi:murein DD-endopeptidase MepM/ murein hydrolase activator NlpD